MWSVMVIYIISTPNEQTIPFLLLSIVHYSLLGFFSHRNDTGVFVSDIVTGGIVESDGRLLQGDQILSVNGEDVRGATQESVAALLKVNKQAALKYFLIKQEPSMSYLLYILHFVFI